MIQYQFALDDSGNLIDAEDAIRHTLYSCPYCHDGMIPKQGEIKAWHYAHKTSPCNYGNYLLAISKQRIREWYNSAPHVLIEYKTRVSCDKRNTCIDRYSCKTSSQMTTRTFDLKSRFNECRTSFTYKKDGHSYTPDLILLNTSDPNYPAIFIEMKIKGIDMKKTKMNERRIEFEIRSEEDIKSICSPQAISEYYQKSADDLKSSVIFHNFKIKTQTEKAEEVCSKMKETTLFSFIY